MFRYSSRQWSAEQLRIIQHEHDLLREADLRFAEERDRRYADVAQANDRRYTEIAQERERAVEIREKANEQALELARQIQTYKDEKANELREQIASERGTYVQNDRFTSVVTPIQEYVSRQQGRAGGIGLSTKVVVGGLSVAGVLFGIAFGVVQAVVAILTGS